MAARLAIVSLAAFAALAVPAAGDRHGAPVAGGGSVGASEAGQRDGVGPETRRLGREIARLRREIADLERLAVWQRELLRAAKSDPPAAMRQRRPMADCLSSAFAPVCDRLTAMFAPPERPPVMEGRTPGLEAGPR